MTQPDLFNPPAPAVEKPKRTRAKVSLGAQVADYFLAHPGQWVDMHAFAFAGMGGWSARIRDLRKPPPIGRSWTIENRWRVVKKYDPYSGRTQTFRVSEYMFVPPSVGATGEVACNVSDGGV